MKTIAIVPARSGSKGFINKNIALINGKTLIEHAISVAISCEEVNDIYISTDSEEYEKIAIRAGAKSFELRPDEYSGDTVKTNEAIIDLIGKINKEYDYIILLQPTSPIRTPQDISNMLKIVRDKKAEACVSVEKVIEPHPLKLKSINENGYIQSFIPNSDSEIPRQLLPPAYKLNGAVYIVDYKSFIANKSFLPKYSVPYEMDRTINIDSEEDFLFLELMIKQNRISIFE